ncbi:MAG: DAK2 domain-containing protein [Ilumatobacteraceae bacterium]
MPVLELFGADALRFTVIAFRDTMRAHAEGINRLNVYPVPDGDTGTNMARTLDAVVAELEGADSALEPTCEAISHGSLMGARGNSGVILSQILRGLSSTLRTAGSAGSSKVADALKAASDAAYEAVLRPIEGTILTVIRETADAAQRAASDGATLAAMLRVARAAGRTALANTPEQLAVLKDAGVVDAGGAGFMLFMDSAIHIVDGEPLPEPELIEGPSAEQLDAAMHRGSSSGEVDVSELRYEVMFLLDLADDNAKSFKSAWGDIGDSIVVVGGDGLYNCHIHTNDIGAAIEAPLQLGGRPHRIRVTDLFEEVADDHAAREATLGIAPGEHGVRKILTSSALPPVTCAVVAVCSGDGLAELFGQMGVHGVVTGGQTMNPSTSELLDAVEHMNAEQVVILPNNKNIIAVANQVNSLTTKDVQVVPTCSMPEALAALVFYDPEATAIDNARNMTSATEAMATGEVTQAVRDTKVEIGPVRAGDWIGLVRGDGIVSIGGTEIAAATALLDHLITDGRRELLTIITGAGVTAAMTADLGAHMAKHHSHVEVEVHAGGQPLYPFLFGVE